MRRLLLSVLLVLLLLLVAPACGGSGSLLRSEVVVRDAAFPTALAFAPDGRLFNTELRSGDIRVVSADGGLLPEPFAHVSVAAKGEWGLLGLALDPNFSVNHYLYVYFMRRCRQRSRLRDSKPPRRVGAVLSNKHRLTRYRPDAIRVAIGNSRLLSQPSICTKGGAR
jgi:hypothetical protein